METKHTTISIPKELYKKIQERIKGTGFTSVSDYVTYVLRQVVSELDEDQEEPFTKEDEDKVKERLRSLGYIE